MINAAADRCPAPPDRLAEVADAASRALWLLPALHNDLRPGQATGPAQPLRRIRTDLDTVERDLVRLV
ncbi:hypothetical protein ABZV80_46005 [Streptomyces sp. NPDC005132]|uniref:hypothetical protein n=1 Tax=Streptomyces sp. NPDC005132 TaxID=3154294 RepID=UPI0033A0FC83